MSETKKSIVIDSQSLLGGGGTSGSKRKSRRTGTGAGERKIRPSSIVQPSTLKKTLLERIKQHQRTRERAREYTDTTGSVNGGGGGGGGSTGGGSSANDNFTQSMNFLRELALKRRTTQRRSSSPITNKPNDDIKTPEANVLHQVSETLHNGEILTNTGLLGLPVVPTLSSQIPAVPTLPAVPAVSTVPVMTAPMAFTIPESSPSVASSPTPKITELVDMYNNTIASVDTPTFSSSAVDTANGATQQDPPLHIPTKPEDYLPSIFVKEDPPHGCLKGGRKPTFREWVGKVLGKGGPPGVPPGVPPPYDGGANGGASGGAGGGASGGAMGVPPPYDGGESGGASGSGAGGGGASGSGAGGGDIDPNSVTGLRVKIRKTKKKSYRLGKHDNVVSVLLRNKQTQRHIQDECHTLRQKTIGEIRKYLYDHHLLKIGSNAPPDVLRRMYEDAILTGDVKNTNNGVLLHNFMAGGGGGE